ncbi:MAG: Tgt2/MlaC family protein [Planctomycetota bacterium]
MSRYLPLRRYFDNVKITVIMEHKGHRNRLIRRLCCGLLLLLMAGQYVNADDKDPNEPNKLLRTKWDAVVSVLQNKDIEQEEKEEQISKIVNPSFDFPLMAKLALGKKNWPKLNEQQRKKFTELFIERVSTSYCDKISLYTDEKVLFKPSIQKKKTTYIPMELISKDKTIAMLYKLRKVDGCWKIYDVEIEGVSIILTYRSQFDDILRRGTVEELLSRLEKPATR